jgi:hypothetical protein
MSIDDATERIAALVCAASISDGDNSRAAALEVSTESAVRLVLDAKADADVLLIGAVPAALDAKELCELALLALDDAAPLILLEAESL